MSVSHPVLIYAELLSNIRQVSVACSLRTPVSPSTSASVSSDGRVLTVNHDGVETSVRLPGPVAPIKQLPVQSLGAKSLSWRLPLVLTSGHDVPSTQEGQTVPWSANDLQPESPISCRTCHATIVESGTIKEWKDLPSENWAEMMEFWHCHKPHDHGHGHGHNDGLTTSKAYGASSRISAQSGIGFVDLTSFLLSGKDVSSDSASALEITKSQSSPEPRNEAETCDNEHKDGEAHHLRAENLPYFCQSCKSQVGVLNDQGTSVSLFKWQIHVNERAHQTPHALPGLPHCLSAMLIATMARSGCSKSIILPIKLQDQQVQDESQANETTESLLNIWVFNSNITFSSTEEARSPIPAVKVFYRMVTQAEADKLLDSMTSDVQDIYLPADAIQKVVDILTSSNHVSPQNDRQLKNWKVGLLEKWDGTGG
ncbi:ubiquitin-conjugating enzyme E2-binding protein [Hypoxylon sp. FL1857]|nr:ubiquitin-conjugating enzyme E2-binding protein [Hypoxylon sp. FL1857]